MEQSGIIRRIDELGRIVIPKEIRKSLRINNGDMVEVFVDNDNISLRKYSMIDRINSIVEGYANAFNNVLKHNIIITDTDKIVGISGKLKNKYLNKEISDDILKKIQRRETNIVNKKSSIEICSGLSEDGYFSYAPIINNGDSLGLVIILSIDSPIMEQEEKLASILSNILSTYFA